MKSYHALALLTSCAICAPAYAREEVVYEPAPHWVDTVDLAALPDVSDTNILAYDQQYRIEDGQLWQYLDTAYRLASAQELTQAGTIVANWLPDKGDLIVHEVAILRGDETIDVLAAGERLEILRRETALEQRSVNGALTATLAVPGLKLNDVLRVRYSVTSTDQVLGDEVQNQTLLYREDAFRTGFGRVRASWKADEPVRYLAGAGVTLDPPVEAGGYQTLELALPLEEGEEMPADAPPRYQRPAILQVGTFSGWDEVSAVMAPYYEVTGSIAEDGELAGIVADIRSGHESDLERAVAALEVVQEDIGYLANGLDGGNYIPQQPEETWSLRYGDCKAKTVLLLAMLGELGIEAEAALVSTTMGDAVPDMLPMAGAFDHVIVKATIDGNAYWLDGTSAGANLKIVGNVPPYFNALPVRAEGAGLERIEQVLPPAPQAALFVELDQSAGIDIPALASGRAEMTGPSASMINASAALATEEQIRELAYRVVYPVVGSGQVVDARIEAGDDDSEARIYFDMFLTSPTSFEGTQGKQQLRLPINNFGFSPERGRRAWREIPVFVGAPSASQVSLTLLFPELPGPVELEGKRQIDETIAGRHLIRSTTLVDGRLTVEETVASSGGEIAPADIAANRRRAVMLSRDPLTVVFPEDAPRRWQYAGGADRAALAAVEAAYAVPVEREPDEVQNYLNRAWFRLKTFDFAGALEDYDMAIDLDASADNYAYRAHVHAEQRDLDGKLADLDEAYALDPDPWRAISLAYALADIGDIDAAREIIAAEDGDEDIRRALAGAQADFDARTGDFAAGLARLDLLLDDDPDDATLLNNKCWYMGTWNITPEQALPVCTRAVENSQNSASVLDSRAMVNFRAGRFDAALADIEAALALEPNLTNSVLLRGLIRREQGDPRGLEDVREALSRSPSITDEYARYGFDLEF